MASATSICCRASASRRSGTRIRGSPRALTEQAATLIHTSNLFFHPLQGQLAARLSALSGLERAFFCNSGAEANEACLKFARRYWHTKGAPRTEFVAFEHAFAGRTIGRLSVTWDEHYRGPFEPLVPGVTFVSNDDPDAVRRAVTDRTAAIIVEPIQGEGGVRPLPPEIGGGHRGRVPSHRRAAHLPTKCSRDWAVPGRRSTSRRSG